MISYRHEKSSIKRKKGKRGKRGKEGKKGKRGKEGKVWDRKRRVFNNLKLGKLKRKENPGTRC